MATRSHDNVEDINKKALAISITCITVATLAVVGRFVARYLKELQYGMDDWMAVVALLATISFFAVYAAYIPYGLGAHVGSVSPENQIAIQRALWALNFPYIVAPTAVKLSALFLYKRVFISPKFTRLVLVSIGIITAWFISSLLIVIFMCTPVNAFWTGEGSCIVFTTWAIAYAVPNITFDFLVWLMPIPLIWKLQLPVQQKIALTFIFMIGLADCAVAIVRAVLFVPALGNPDFTYAPVPTIWWTILHPSLGIISICLPTMRVFITMGLSGFSKSIARAFGTATHQSTSNSGSFTNPWPRTTRFANKGADANNTFVSLATRSDYEPSLIKDQTKFVQDGSLERPNKTHQDP